MKDNETIKKIYERQRLLSKDNITIKPSKGGTVKLSTKEIEEIKLLAVDEIIPVSDYIRKVTEILNRKKRNTNEKSSS